MSAKKVFRKVSSMFQNTVTKSPPPVRKISRVGNRSKFASLVRLAKYKKMVTTKPVPEADNTKTNTEEEVKMPEQPRFSATLSPEAQYAMLKGYEDILLNNLKNEKKQQNNEEKDAGTLFRVKTPHHKVASLHLNGCDEDCIDEEDEKQAEVREILPSKDSMGRKAWDIRPAPYLGQLYRIDSKDDMGKGINRRDSKALLAKRSDSQDIGKALPKDKQLLLTHRFHCAMDILDTMKESQGVMVTSPRYKQRRIKPVDNYNAWSKEWSREFKLEYR